jgi:hypothetical protein
MKLLNRPTDVPEWRLRPDPRLQRADAELNEARQALIAAVRWVNELEHRKEKADKYRELMEDRQLTVIERERAVGPTEQEFATGREAVELRTQRLDRALASVEKARQLPKVDAFAAAERAGVEFITRKKLTYLGRDYMAGEPIDLSGLTPDKRRRWVDVRLVEPT